MQVQCHTYHSERYNIYIDCTNVHYMNNIKTYQLNSFSQRKTYSSLHISQLTCVIITIAVWNNPEIKTQAKQSSERKKGVLNSLLNSSVDLKSIKRKD